MSSTRAVVVSVSVVVLAALASACETTEKACTAESSGFGAQTRLRQRVLSEPVSREECRPRLETIRSDSELRSAYEAMGVAILNPDGGESAPEAMRLPIVDWEKQTVLLREATDAQSISWIVIEGDTLTVGTQGCVSAGTGACAATLVVVPAVATKAKGHSCGSIACDAIVQDLPP